MVSVVHSVAAQSDFEHSLQALADGLPAAEPAAPRRAVEICPRASMAIASWAAARRSGVMRWEWR
jgi:hypothetical protein